MRRFWRCPLGHSLQSKFSPFFNRKLSPVSNTSGLISNFWNFNNTVFIREKKIPENVLKLTNLWLKSANRTRNGVYRVEQKLVPKKQHCLQWEMSMHFFVQLCRPNDQSNNFKVFSAFVSSTKTFGNIFGINVFLMNTMLLKFRILHTNRKCAKWVESSDCKTDLTCSVWCILVAHVQNDTLFEPRHDKTNKMSVHPAKTQISLGIRPVWSESSLCAQWVAKDPRFIHADSEDSDQTGRMPRLIWVFAERTATLLVLSCRGSFGFSLSVCMIFKICCQFLENAIFEKFVKILPRQKSQRFWVFSVWCTTLSSCTQWSGWKFG